MVPSDIIFVSASSAKSPKVAAVPPDAVYPRLHSCAFAILAPLLNRKCGK